MERFLAIILFSFAHFMRSGGIGVIKDAVLENDLRGEKVGDFEFRNSAPCALSITSY